VAAFPLFDDVAVRVVEVPQRADALGPGGMVGVVVVLEAVVQPARPAGGADLVAALLGQEVAELIIAEALAIAVGGGERSVLAVLEGPFGAGQLILLNVICNDPGLVT
jgi:CO/xanthine dehydrogenase Mo-binding subunit